MKSERQGVEIECCPKCRGVWLDRGELDQMVEQSMQAALAQAQVPPQNCPQPSFRSRDSGYGYPSMRETPWLGELFY